MRLPTCPSVFVAVVLALVSQAPSMVKAEQEQDVEFFRAIADGQLAVDYVAKDATQANLIFHNQTNHPLSIQINIDIHQHTHTPAASSFYSSLFLDAPVRSP